MAKSEHAIDMCRYETLDVFGLIAEGESNSLLVGMLKDLSSVCVTCLQMTSQDIQMWEQDPNEYVAAEDDVTDSYSPRSAAQLLLGY